MSTLDPNEQPLDIDLSTGNLVPMQEKAPRSVVADTLRGVGHKPKRSWKKGNKEQGTFDGRFKYEGAAIYIQSLADDEWDALEALEEELQDTSELVADEQQLIQLEQKQLQRALESDKPDLDYAALRAQSRELAKRQRDINKQTKEMAAKLFEFQSDVVRKTVIFWEDAPIEYTPEAVDELPKEMVGDWSQIILEKSRLGKSKADFLPNS